MSISIRRVTWARRSGFDPLVRFSGTRGGIHCYSLAGATGYFDFEQWSTVGPLRGPWESPFRNRVCRNISETLAAVERKRVRMKKRALIRHDDATMTKTKVPEYMRHLFRSRCKLAAPISERVAGSERAACRRKDRTRGYQLKPEIRRVPRATDPPIDLCCVALRHECDVHVPLIVNGVKCAVAGIRIAQ